LSLKAAVPGAEAEEEGEEEAGLRCVVAEGAAEE
jgi:hypothetical protein